MAELSVRKQLVPGQTFAHKFRLERRIGSGGMGVVWRAWNLQLDIPVAIKVMNAQFAEQAESVARFEREAKAAARIRGRHVVNIYEHGVHDGLLYMAMELLEGEDLNQRLKREGRLSLEATARVVGDLCKALQRAHELGVVHRDLKPANVFLTRDGDEEIAKVLDLGVAKLMYATDGGFVSETGQMLGTPIYMSPEQIRDTKHVDARADLWSLAVIAFRALTGAFPFSGSMFDITSRILGGPTPVASSFAPDLAPEVDAFFARAMARHIDRRFQSARELSNAFSELSGSAELTSGTEPLLSDPPTDEAVTLSQMKTERFPDHEGEGRPPPVASAADQTVAEAAVFLSEIKIDRLPERESRPTVAALAADQALAVRRPVHKDLADATVAEGAARRRGRSWISRAVIVSTIVVIVAALLAVAFSSRPDRGFGALPPRDSTPG